MIGGSRFLPPVAPDTQRPDPGAQSVEDEVLLAAEQLFSMLGGVSSRRK